MIQIFNAGNWNLKGPNVAKLIKPQQPQVKDNNCCLVGCESGL